MAASPVADVPPPSVTRPECSGWGRAPPERMPRGGAPSQAWRGSDALRVPASLSPEPTDLPFTAVFSGHLSCIDASELGVQTQRTVFLGCDWPLNSVFTMFGEFGCESWAVGCGWGARWVEVVLCSHYWLVSCFRTFFLILLLLLLLLFSFIFISWRLITLRY